ncbi:MAG TPA: TolC family protein [Chthoniobacterales bacterium]|nr:TolC family protein [Chthoniobacterales bacterium]
MRNTCCVLSLFIGVTAASPLSLDGASAGGAGQSRTQGSHTHPLKFTLDQAILTALKQNPSILNAKQEIERSKGVILQIGAEALPRVAPQAQLQWTSPGLNRTGFSSGTTTGTTPGATPGIVSGSAAAPSPTPSSASLTDTSYAIRITGTQLVFNYSTFRSIRGTFFQRDNAYFAFRDIVDQVIATTKTQFYQIILNKALIDVQEESVRLLESQLKDQQNRFEAGTVPRFNVLQAQVALSNQIPNLIAARNNYRISQLQLAKTLGLDFNPRRGENPPLEVEGEMQYIAQPLGLTDAIELGKQRRPLLKRQRAAVLNQIEQVHVALGGFLPNFGAVGGYEIFSSPTTTSFEDASKGWLFGLQGSWAIWDSGATYGSYKQQRALLSEAEITYDDDVRQVELEVQQAYSNLQQNRELIQATEKTVEQAQEALRLAKARLDAGAGTQLDVLNAQVQLTQAESTRLQALFGYDSSLAEFNRVTGAQATYTEAFDGIAPRATQSRTYYTGSDVDARGRPKPRTGLESIPVTPMSSKRSGK